MNFKWQVCSIEQAEELNGLGIVNPSDLFVWFWSVRATDLEAVNPGYKKTKSLGIKSPLDPVKKSEPIYVTDEKLAGLVTYSTFNAFTLAEIAVMLGYSFTQSNVLEATEKLINEIKTGASTVKDCNSRLLEAQTL